MLTFAQKQAQPHRETSSIPFRPTSAILGPNHYRNPILRPQHEAGNQASQRLLQADGEEPEMNPGTNTIIRLVHDFSRTPIYPPMSTKHMTPVIQRKLVPTETAEPNQVTRQVSPAPAPAPAPAQTACPTQSVTMSGAQCGSQYGAVGRYCYNGAAGWWFKERVTMGSPNTCVPGASITQTTTPIQSATGCVSDLIFNFNGPPANVAPCTIVTNQTVFTGPTQATVTQCQYNNRQVIQVTETPGSNPRSGKVITSSAGVSTDCNWS